MKARVFSIHGWGDSPQGSWFSWLAHKLEAHGFEVRVPAMPEPDKPKMEEWVPFLAEQVGKSGARTYFVTHSIGYQTVLRYCAKLPDGKSVGGAVFVAGWTHLKTGMVVKEGVMELARPWLELPIE